ncbi:MAG: DUF2027 domain-containing protein [Bacteroidales bacterium]|jgi:DNA-nicking Smr family endonuclease|nr:DUF2027 domain-containing protein [Bacteroidales bacterium]
MNINIGDKVRFLNDVGGGTVVEKINKTQAMVRDANGFEYPYPVNELVVIEKASQVQEEKKIEKKEGKKNVEIPDMKKNIELKDNNDSEVLFAFIKKINTNEDGFDCYLINDSNFYIFYHVVLRGENGYEKLDAEVLEPNTKIAVGELFRNQINFSKEIIIQMLFFNHPYQVLRNMVERRIKIVPINFFQEHRFLENDFFDEKAYIFELLKEKQGLGESLISQEDFENNQINKDRLILIREEEQEDKSKRYSQRKKAPEIEVDLHINQLVDSVIGLSNAEILKIQMDTFHKTMTDAIMNKAGKVILIHGIGNGTLKAALRESLDVQYKLPYEDASFREYGFGATMVILNSGN